jgi:hypothetical protein
LCLLNLRGETKFLRFNDFVSLVKSNNKRESGGGIFNKVKEVAGKIFSKENVDKLNNWPEKAWENTKKRFDDKIGAIESKLGIAGLSEDELEGFLIDHVMGKATLEKGFNRDGEETTTLIPNGESTRIAKLTALLLNGKIGMSSRIFAEAAVFKKYGVDLREITEIKAHLLDREYRGDHEENGSKEAFVRAGKVVAKGIGNFITRRFAPVSSNLDAEGKRAVDPRRAEKKWLDNTQTFDKIVKRLIEKKGGDGITNSKEAHEIIAKFESFDWKDLMPVNAGDRSKLEQAAWIFSSIIPPEMVEAVRATSLVGIFSMDIGGRLAENLIANEKYMDNKFLVGLARFSAKPAVRSLVKALSDTSRGVGGGLMAAKGFYLLEDLLDMMGHDVDLTPSISMDDITKAQDMLTEMGNSASDKAESVGSSVAENFNEFKDNATTEFNRIAENVDKVAENFRMPEMPNIDLPDFKMPEIDFSKVGDLKIVQFAKEIYTQGKELLGDKSEELRKIVEGINFDELGKPIQATPEQVEAIKEFIKDAKNLPAEAQKLIAEQIEKMDLPEMPSMPDIDLSDIELPSIDVDLSKFKDMDVIKVALEIIEKFQDDPSAGIEKLKELIPEVNINVPPTPEFIAKAREAIEDYIKNGEDSLKKYIYDQLEKIQDSLDASDETPRPLPDSPLGEGSDPGLAPDPDAAPTPDSSPTPQPLDPQPMAPDFPNPEMPAPEIDGSLHEVAKTADREWMEIFREQSNAAHPSADMGNREMIARIANGQFDLQGDVIKLPSDEIMDNFSQTMEVAIKELGPVADMDTELISSMSPDKVAALAGYFGDADRLARAVLADDPSMMSESRIGQVNENINWRAVVDFLKDITK